MKNINQLLCGFYISRGKGEPKHVDVEATDYVNCVILSAVNVEGFRADVERNVAYGNVFWVNTQFLECRVMDGVMIIPDDWQKKMDDVVALLKEWGAYERFLGWYMDEPLLNRFTPEQVHRFSRYNHEKFGKRYFICFAVEEFAPEEYSDGIVKKHMTREFSPYITDGAYDMYWDFAPNRGKYERINNRLRENLPDDCRIWYVPWTYLNSNKTYEEAQTYEERLLEHLEAMYTFLKAEKNPGGLMSFLWHGEILGFYGVEEVTAAGYWKKLHCRLEEIGNEIVSGAWKK